MAVLGVIGSAIFGLIIGYLLGMKHGADFMREHQKDLEAERKGRFHKIIE